MLCSPLTLAGSKAPPSRSGDLASRALSPQNSYTSHCRRAASAETIRDAVPLSSQPRGAPRRRAAPASIHVQSARAARPRAVAAPRKTNRRLATDEKPPQKKKSAVERATEDDIDDLVPLTPAQKVGVGLNLSAWAAGLGLASVCGYFIFRELMPTKLSPNSVFDKAFEVIRSNSTIERVYGTPLKGYGRDHGGHREPKEFY